MKLSYTKKAAELTLSAALIHYLYKIIYLTIYLLPFLITMPL